MCRKNPIGHAHPELPQSRAERNQVIVVNPDQIVGTQQRQEIACKLSVDVLVCVALLRTKSELAGHVVEYRPERAIREAVVVELEFLAAKLARDVRDAIAHVDIRLGWLASGELAVPPEPDAAAAPESGEHTDRQASGGDVARWH